MGLRTFFGALRLARHSEKIRQVGARAANDSEAAAEAAAELADTWERFADPAALAELFAETLAAAGGDPARTAWEAAIARRESEPWGFIAAGSEVFAAAADIARAASEAKATEARVVRRASRSLALAATANEAEAALATVDAEIEEKSNEAAEEMESLEDATELVRNTGAQLTELALGWWVGQRPE